MDAILKEEPYLWIVAVVVVALVVCLALFLRRGIKASIGKGGVLFESKEPRQTEDVTTVAKGLVVGPDGETGDITGEESSAGAATQGGSKMVSVLEQGRVDGKIGNVTGKVIKGDGKG